MAALTRPTDLADHRAGGMPLDSQCATADRHHPVTGTLLRRPQEQLPILLASLALGTPLLSLLGTVVAALTVTMQRTGILVALLA